MKTKSTLLKKLALGILIISSLNGVSQSNPTPFNLETGGTYTFTDWLSTSTPSTYPNNMIFHIMANVNPTLTSVASSDVVAGVYNDASAKTRMNGLGTGGFSFRNSSTTPDITGYVSNRLGEAVLGINTTNRTTINVSFKAGEIGSATPVYSITCQYRIGTTGAYLSLPGASTLWQYISTDPASSLSFGPITLPAACDNQSVVQLRWAYTYVSGTTAGLKPQLFVDDITVTSIPLITLTPLPNTCSSNPPFLLTDGQPAGGVYTGTGVVGGNFDPSVAGIGIQTITYTYTDINGFSNFASTTIDVEASYCVTTTSLKPVSCGATGLSIGNYIYCEPVYGATDYEFSINNVSLGYSQTKVRATYTSINLSSFTGLKYGQTYNVKVRAKVGGIWGGFGTSCPITLMAFPSTQLTTASCGATGLSISSYIYCNPIAGASDYEFTINNTSLGYSQVRTRVLYSSANLNQYSGLLYGQTYDVSVRAKVSGAWGPVGSSCPITLMAFPSTQLTTASCGAVALTISSFIYCNTISGASDYEFTISNSSLGYSQVRNRALYSAIKLTSYSGLIAGTTYDVIVRAKVSGVWGPTGTVCPITMGSTIGLLSQYSEETKQMEVEISEFGNTEIKLYPNPINISNQLNVELANPQSLTITISDIMGKRIFEKFYSEVNSIDIPLSELQIDAGIYNLSLMCGNTVQNKKLVITK